MTDRRQALLAALKTRDRFPVVIIGAGINGLGTFRDLSLQGVDCLIVDRGDFCAGASRAPSRMIHGGLKYLETGEFRLVSESARERNLLLKNAAHRVRPLEMVIPIYSRFGGLVSSIKRFFGLQTKLVSRGSLIVRAGLTLYDLYGRFQRVMPTHRMISREDALNAFPDLDPRIRAAASYYDAWIASPERLSLELALDGMAASPDSIALNHLAFEGMRDSRLQLLDRLDGTSYEVGADLVINAAGAWIDPVNRRMNRIHKRIGGTKGSHLILDLPALSRALRDRMIYFEVEGRICMVSSYLGNILLGSTDIPIADPDKAVCTDDEVEYLLDAFRRIFPSLPVARDDILFTYSGVRPLPASNADDPGAVSRDHSIVVDEPDADRPFPVLSLIGGKWTTFRSFSEQTTDAVLERLGRSRKIDTRDQTIGGGAGLAQAVAPTVKLVQEVKTIVHCSTPRASDLVLRYGSQAIPVARHLAQSGDQPLRTLPEYSMQEVQYVARQELVTSTTDFIFGRTSIFIEKRITSEMVEELSAMLKPVLGWSDQQSAEDQQAVARYLRQRHLIDIEQGGHYIGERHESRETAGRHHELADGIRHGR